MKQYLIVSILISVVVGAGVGFLVGNGMTIASYESRIDQLEDTIEDLGGTIPEEKPVIDIAFAGTSATFIDYNRYKAFQNLEEMGYTVNVNYIDTRASIAALVSGEVDFITTTAMEYLPAIEDNGSQIVQMAPTNTRGYLLVTADDINSIADLEGRVVGASSYTAISYLYLKYALEDAGVDPDDVTWNMVGGSSARRAALVGGSIEAGLLYAEYALELDKLEGLHILGPVTDFLATGEVTSGLAVRQDFIDEYPFACQDFAKAIALANVFALTRGEEFIDEGMAWYEAESGASNNRSYYASLYEGYREWNVYTLSFTEANAERAVDLALDAGSIETEIPVSQWNNFTFWQTALEELYLL
jgi:NitT/TauT family transport system substrate-binding protein